MTVSGGSAPGSASTSRRRGLTGAVCGAIALTISMAGCAAPEESDVGGSTTTDIPTLTQPTEAASPSASETTMPSESTLVETTLAATTVPEPTVSAEQRAVDFAAIGPIVEAFVDDQGLNGAGLVVVDRNDGIVFQQYWGDFGPDRVSLVASASKMIVAGVLLRLDDQGVLDIDAPIAESVEWGAGNPSITAAQLLSNSSGLVGLGPTATYGPYICQFLAAGQLGECGSTIFTTADDDGDVIAPDTRFRYGGGQWQVAGALAEAVGDRSWTQLVDDTYVAPCGVESLGFNNHWTQFGPLDFVYPGEFAGDPTNLVATDNPNMEGGAYITAPDYAQLLLMQLRDGRCGDVQVLSPAAVRRMHADRIGDVYGGSEGGLGYGLGWWIDRASGRRIDPGAYGAYPWLDLDDGHGGYLVIEADVLTGTALASLLFEPVADGVAAGRR